MLWPGIKYIMYSLQSKSDWTIFIPRSVKARLYIYSSKLSWIGMNRHVKQNLVIHDLKTCYMLWPGIKYPMYSFQSNSDWIIFIPRRVKARLYWIYSSQFSSIGTNRYVKQTLVIRDLKARYIFWPGIKYPMYSFQSKPDCIIFIPQRVKARLYI
jgi:hypothetical protein